MVARSWKEVEMAERLLMVIGFLFKPMKMHWTERLVLVAQSCIYAKTHEFYALKG